MVIGTFHLFDETRSSLLSSSVVKVHHSFGRAHEKQVVRVPERGVRLNDFRDGLATGGIRCRDCLWYVVRSRPVKTAAPDTPHADSGAEETRTPDVLLAKEVLYQLSYGPEAAAPLRGGCTLRA